MPQQPVKKSGPFQKPRSKTVKKRITKKTEETKDKRLPRALNPKPKRRGPRPHKQEYGTSKLEQRFARDFLDKLGIEYKYQFKAESIGRYYDFRGMPKGAIIEVQGSYWHGDKRLYEEEDLNRTQKKNIKVDEIKRRWCSQNGIKLIYVWEEDINKDPEGVMDMLRRELDKYINHRDRLRTKITE